MDVELKPKSFTIPKVVFFCTTDIVCKDGAEMDVKSLRILRDIAKKTGAQLVNIDYERFFPQLVDEFDRIMKRHNLPEVYSYLVETTLEVDPEDAIVEWMRINPTDKFVVIYNDKWENSDHFRTIDKAQLLYCKDINKKVYNRAVKILGEN